MSNALKMYHKESPDCFTSIPLMYIFMFEYENKNELFISTVDDKSFLST